MQHEAKMPRPHQGRQKCEVYSRVVGYLRPVQQWNNGKKQEFADRREFVVPAS